MSEALLELVSQLQNLQDTNDALRFEENLALEIVLDGKAKMSALRHTISTSDLLISLGSMQRDITGDSALWTAHEVRALSPDATCDVFSVSLAEFATLVRFQSPRLIRVVQYCPLPPLPLPSPLSSSDPVWVLYEKEASSPTLHRACSVSRPPTILSVKKKFDMLLDVAFTLAWLHSLDYIHGSVSWDSFLLKSPLQHTPVLLLRMPAPPPDCTFRDDVRSFGDLVCFVLNGIERTELQHLDRSLSTVFLPLVEGCSRDWTMEEAVSHLVSMSEYVTRNLMSLEYSVTRPSG